MRHRLSTIIIIAMLAALITPVAAKISTVDPFQEPTITLDPAEAQKLATLQQTIFPTVSSEVSPDDAYIYSIAASPDGVEPAFVNIYSGARTHVEDTVLKFDPLTEVAWRDTHNAMFISGNMEVGPVIVSMNRDSGAVSIDSVPLPGFPISLAPNGSRVLVALPGSSASSKSLAMHSPFDIVVPHKPKFRTGPTRFDAEQPELKLADDEVMIAAYDIQSSEFLPLVTLPSGSGFASQPMWTPDGSKVTWVRTTIANIGRLGNRLGELTTQDGLGELPPNLNPFFQGNVIDAFDLAGHDLRPAGLKARDGDGTIFSYASWSSDGQTLLAQVQRPSLLTGRQNPIYQYPESAALRFYNADLQLIGAFERPEILGPSSVFSRWVSPDEIIIDAAWGLSYRLFYYNRISGEFRQISPWDGTYYQVRATHQTRQLVFNYSAFPYPPELYRIGWDGAGLLALSSMNAEAMSANQIRADNITFTMRNGAVRTGYLLQPASASFPPHQIPLIVWQQGGPGGTITNEWGSNVEMPFNLLPNFGMAVLVLPLQGREGYGPQLYNDLANGTNFGQIDIDEQAQAVEQMIAWGYAAPGHIGITGCSYGGYFTTQSITQRPGLYTVANTQCTLLDLFNEWQFGYTPFVSYLEGRSPTTDPGEYTRDSPLYNAGKIRAPTLIFDGTRDFLPYTLSSNLHDQINANGVPSDFLLFLGEGHGLAAPNSQFTAAEAQINWFRRYLTPPQR